MLRSAQSMILSVFWCCCY